METIFDQIRDRKIKTDFVYEDDHVLCFPDINPQAPVHILVIPKKKFKSLCETSNHTKEDLGGFMQGISRCASHLNLDEKGYRVVFNTGEDAQQTVDYVHAHILAGRPMKWPPG